MKTDPGPLIRAAWDGHEIGVHTWDHRSLAGRGTADIASDILRTSDEITRVSGVRPTLVRPPYGDVDHATAERIARPVVLWSVDPDDWRDHDPALITQRVTDRAGPGSIVLLHDVYAESEQAVPAIIDHYQAQGYAFVTVSELYAGKLKAGKMYHGRELEVAKARARDKARGVVRPDVTGAPNGSIDPNLPFPPAPSGVPAPAPVAVEPGTGSAPSDQVPGEAGPVFPTGPKDPTDPKEPAKPAGADEPAQPDLPGTPATATPAPTEPPVATDPATPPPSSGGGLPRPDGYVSTGYVSTGYVSTGYVSTGDVSTSVSRPATS